ncbi:unnamed protein product, partial [Lymnaea stagnalis]
MEYLVISHFGLLFAAIMMGMVITRINSLELSDRLDYSSDGQIGTSATIGCNWVKTDSENGLNLGVVTPSNKTFLSYFPAEQSLRNGINFHSRLVLTNTSTSLTMTIMNISCSDIDIYICRMRYFSDSGLSLMEKNSTGRLVDIKIPPQVPVMTPPPLLVVSEGLNITYKCLANLGRPNKGQIVWNAYVNGQKIELPLKPIVKETSDDNNCTVSVESTVTVQANRTKQNITLACFSTNQDFQQTAPPLCTSPGTDLCAQSQPLNIQYAASKLIVNRSPQSDVEEGSTMTLTCQAEGNPQPNYTWLQVGNENRSLNGFQEGLTNKLILSNLNITDDTGVYNCTATNNVGGVNYSITDQVSVNVFLKTTTTTTTTTTRKTTLTSSSSPAGSSATGPQNAGGGDDNTNTIIIAVVVPVACIIIIIIIVVIVCVKKRKQTKSIIE